MPVQRLPREVYVRRRVGAAVVALVALWLLVSLIGALFGGGGSDGLGVSAAGDGEVASGDADTTTTAPETTTTTHGVAADQRELVLIDTIGGQISPKSVVASDTGFVVAQNMMYQHTITVYDRDFNLLKTISDEIRAEDWGLPYAPGTTLQGAPVEASFLPDGSKAFVSNYHMYGADYGPEPSDGCAQLTRDPSFVYRIDMASLEIDQVIQVGTVPKFLAVSPDGTRLVVSNWCSYDVSIIDTDTGDELERVSVGRYPRGVAFSPDADSVYIAIMGGDQIVEIDMGSNEIARTIGVAGSPRHLVMGPEGRFLYVSLNRAGQVAKLDLSNEAIVARLATGDGPRSMDISDDGSAIYVVNYHSDTISKVLTDSFTETQEIPVGHHPIGITYDDETEQVWVANYSGSIMVFEDRPVTGDEQAGATDD